jgi:translation initiation factor IF-2
MKNIEKEKEAEAPMSSLQAAAQAGGPRGPTKILARPKQQAPQAEVSPPPPVKESWRRAEVPPGERGGGRRGGGGGRGREGGQRDGGRGGHRDGGRGRGRSHPTAASDTAVIKVATAEEGTVEYRLDHKQKRPSKTAHEVLADGSVRISRGGGRQAKKGSEGDKKEAGKEEANGVPEGPTTADVSTEDSKPGAAAGRGGRDGSSRHRGGGRHHGGGRDHGRGGRRGGGDGRGRGGRDHHRGRGSKGGREKHHHPGKGEDQVDHNAAKGDDSSDKKKPKGHTHHIEIGKD